MKDFNFKLDIVKSLEQVKSGDRVVIGYASTFDVDSDDTQITREALENAKEDLLTYSTVLFNHDTDRPIGKVIDTEVDDIGLLVKVIISKEEDDVWKKVQEGVINKFSIKGRAVEIRPVEGKDLIQQITKIKLFEVSLVSVPANKEAQTISHWVAKSLILEDVTKGVVPQHNTPKADENRVWSGSAAEKRLKIWTSKDGSGDKNTIDWNKYARGFTWYDGSNKENFGSYKLPHHDIDNNKLVVVWKGVAAAMAALMGARGGVDIPETDKRSAFNHLAKHYKQFNKEVPTFNKTLSDDNEEIDKNEISFNINKNMNELLEKLKNILNKEKSEDIKLNLTNLVNELETEDDILAKLEIVAGKLSGEDKDVVSFAIDLLKRREMKSCEEAELETKTKHFNFDDEKEERPVFQLNSSATEVKLDNDNKFKKQLLKFGKWFHWDADGGVLNITEEVVDSIVKNFKKGLIDHVYVPLSHTNDPTKNAGEVVKLQKTESGLDAVIEIKDETVLGKIKKGLIKCVSASLDPNYRNKSTNKFVGPTLLHAALVSEPFIKGMNNFVSLSDDFEGRNIVQLEDEEPSFFSIMKALKNSLENIENKIVTTAEIEEVVAKIHSTDTIIKDNVEEKTEEDVKETTEGEKVEEEKKEEEVEKTNEVKKENEEKTEEEVKETTEEENKEVEKTKFQTCMSKQMKAGKTMAEAAKICKEESKKTIKKIDSEELSGEQPENKSEDSAKIDFADAERVYEEYLMQGKIVPAQKEAFIKLMVSGKNIQLGDEQVGLSELIKIFMKSQPSSIDFEEEGVPVDEDKETEGSKDEETDLSDVPSDAKDLFSKMGLSGEDAKKSWNIAKKEKKQEDEEKSTLFN